MTTIVLIRNNKEVVVAGDGQVSMGNTVLKSPTAKVRKIEKRQTIVGLAGSNNDALTLYESIAQNVKKHSWNIPRATTE